MENRTYNIYCDESTYLENDGHPYMIYGYVSVAYNQMDFIKKNIIALRCKYKFKGEIKWNNVSESMYPFYADIVDLFFSSNLNFRAVIVDKSQIDNSRPEYTFNDFYFRMYYQLIHHKIDMENVYNIYFDIKDTCSQRKLHKLKEILKYNASIRNFQFIRSYESYFMQLADLLMGAINYNLRIQFKEIEGKVCAKLKLIDKIKSQTQSRLCASTKKDATKFNLFFIDLK